MQCQGADRPLCHIAEPSTKERLRKWTRRHPRILAVTAIGLLIGILLSAFASLFLIRGRELDRLAVQERERIQRDADRDQAATAWRKFQDDLRTAQFLLYTRTTEPEQLADGVTLGRKLMQSYRVLDDADWQQATLVQALPADEGRRLGDSMAELLLLTARALSVQHGDDPTSAAGRVALEQALVMNARAADLSANSPALWQQRGRLQTLLGQQTLAKQSQERAKALPLLTAADHYWLASDHLAAGGLRDALPLLQKATHMEPANFWGWFVLGNCYDRLGMDARAEACYGACIALRPDFPWAHFNRGLALYRQQDYRLACDDFDAVIALRPDLADAYLNRALARSGITAKPRSRARPDGRPGAGGGPIRLYFLRPCPRAARQQSGAQADIAEAMRRHAAR